MNSSKIGEKNIPHRTGPHCILSWVYCMGIIVFYIATSVLNEFVPWKIFNIIFNSSQLYFRYLMTNIIINLSGYLLSSATELIHVD